MILSEDTRGAVFAALVALAWLGFAVAATMRGCGS